MAVVVPSFVVALRYIKDIDDNKGQITDQFSSENAEDNILENKWKRFWALWEKAVAGSVKYGQNLRDKVTQCCAFDEQTRCELEVRCGILTGEANLKTLFNGMSVATTKAHLEGVGAELKKSLRTLGAKKALEALEAASADKEPPLDGMNAIRAKPGAREVVNMIACFRDVQKLFRGWDVFMCDEETEKLVLIGAKMCAILQYPTVCFVFVLVVFLVLVLHFGLSRSFCYVALGPALA